MSTGQQLLLVYVVGGVVVMALYRAAITKGSVVEALFHLGPPVAVAAAGGSVRLLIIKALTLQHVTAIDKKAVITEGKRFDATGLSHFGRVLVYDDIYVYGVVAILLGMIVFDFKRGSKERERLRPGFLGFARAAALGYILPFFLGVSALFLVYLRS